MELETRPKADQVYEQLTEQQEALVTDSHEYRVDSPTEENRYCTGNGPNYARTIAELDNPEVKDIHSRLEEQGLNYDQGMIRRHLTDLQRADVVELTMDDEVSLTEQGQKLLE